MRGDVALKTILRHMRKYYLEDFRSKTQYVSFNSRSKNKCHLQECLEEYADFLLSEAKKSKID